MKGHCSISTAAGGTYCALGAMSFLGKSNHLNKADRALNVWPSDESNRRLLGWLFGLQTSILQEEDLSVPDAMGTQLSPDLNESQNGTHSEGAAAVAPEAIVPNTLGVEPLAEDLQWAGMTGRCNKVADTCYAFWAGGSLTVRD